MGNSDNSVEENEERLFYIIEYDLWGQSTYKKSHESWEYTWEILGWDLSLIL